MGILFFGVFVITNHDRQGSETTLINAADARIEEAKVENVKQVSKPLEIEIKSQTPLEADPQIPEEADTQVTESVEPKTSQETVSKTDSQISNIRDMLSQMKCAVDAKQIIIVVENAAEGPTLFFCTKSEDDLWMIDFSTDADIGKNGITTEKKEGDGMTPAGCYPITAAFGIKEDPGAVIPYRQITDTSYWVDDTQSPYYNQWADSAETGISFTSEHLIKHSPSYNYVLNIGYNLECIPGLGSAIFLHCKGGKGITTGCIGIDENTMKQIVTMADLATQIVIVKEENELLNY